MPGAILIDNIYVDATKSFTFSDPLNVTSHPIEDGTQITDCVTEAEKEITIEAVFGDDKYKSRGAPTLDARGGLSSAKDKEAAIRQLKKERRIVNITSLDDRYNGYILAEIQAPKTIKNINIFEATLIFKKVDSVKTGTAQVPPDKLKKKPPAKVEAAEKQAETEEQGEKPAVELTVEEKKAVASSLLRAGLRGL